MRLITNLSSTFSLSAHLASFFIWSSAGTIVVSDLLSVVVACLVSLDG